MDKLVYLFELDSVHTSREEIRRGQWALFEETVLNGNQVVLTFNQLTDSQAFLCAIRDPRTYPHMLELFRLGALKISRFAPPGSGESLDEEGQAALRREVEACREAYAPLFRDGVLKSYPPLPAGAPQRVLRTASHYIQLSVEKCLNDDRDSFLFSALPFRSQDKEILAALSYALQYSDPSVLDTCSFRFGEEGEEQGRERLDYVKRYVEMILQLSREPLAANPEKTGERVAFTDMLDRVFRTCSGTEGGDGAAALLPRALEILARLRETAFGPGRSILNRSNWYAALGALGQEDPALLARAVVDLCYNYTMEASISGAARRYWDDASFRADFLRRLEDYWDDVRRGVHRFGEDERSVDAFTPERFPPWDTAARLLRSAPPEGTADPEARISARREREDWRLRVGRSLLKQFGAASVYFALFVATSYGLDLLEGGMSEVGARFQMNDLFMSLFNIVLFGLAGSLLSAVCGLPDILDSIKAFFTTAWDGVRLLRASRRRRKEGRGWRRPGPDICD